MERQTDKQLKASKSLEANRRYRQNMRDKLSAVKSDTRLDEILDRLTLIQKRLDGIMSDSDSDSDTESEPDQIEPVKKKSVKKSETEVVLKAEPKKSEVKTEPKKAVRVVKPVEPDMSEELQRTPYMHQYSAFV